MQIEVAIKEYLIERVLNVIQNEIPRSILLAIRRGSKVVLVFDTDVQYTERLKKNIADLKKNCSGVKVACFLATTLFLQQYATCIACSTSFSVNPSLSGLSAGLKNRRMEVRHLFVPPAYCSFVQRQDSGLISRECGFESRRSNQSLLFWLPFREPLLFVVKSRPVC